MIPGLLITQGKDTGLYLSIPEGSPFWIGRTNQCNYILENDPVVSGKHCFLLRRGDQVALKDESTNGSHINGRKYHKQTVILKLADIIRIGNTHFQVVNLDQSNTQQEEPDFQANINEINEEELERNTNHLNAFGPFLNIEVIGAGAAGTVYKSIHTKLKKVVALKVMSNFEEMSEQFVGRFLREIELLKQMDHPHIIKLYDMGTLEMNGENRHYIALEYFPGVNLNHHVRIKGAFSWQKTAQVLSQSLQGIGHMHQKNILHRDIKPGNIMFDDIKGIAKIIDLGLGKSLVAEERQTLCITQPDSVMGTPNFMPYEQWGGMSNVTERTDIYSLGATTYFLLSGTLPYGKNRDYTQIYRSVIKKELTPLAELAPKDTPPSFIQLIDKMMAFDPKNRYPSCEAILSDLKKLSF